MSDIDKYQNLLVDILKEEKYLKKRKDDLKDEIESKGYYIHGNKIEESEVIIGYISKWSYFSKYVGEKGALYDYNEYASVLKDFDFEQNISLINKYKSISKEEFKWTLELLDFFVFYWDNELFGECINFPSVSQTKEFHIRKWYYKGDENKIEENNIKEFNKKCYELIQMFNYNSILDQIEFRYKGTDRSEEYIDDSGFNVGKYKKEFLISYKSKSVDDTFDYKYSEIDW